MKLIRNLGSLPIIVSYIKLGIRLDGPTPPPGSDIDQSTLGYEPDTSIVVAGEMGGNPAQEHYIFQQFTNDRDEMTGFGGVFGYLGPVTEDIIIAVTSNLCNPNIAEDCDFIVGFTVSPDELEPGELYYIYGTHDPIDVIGAHYLLAATNESWVEGGVTKGWIWAGIESAPYPGNCYVFDGSQHTSLSVDTLFFTFTDTGGTPQNCDDYTNQTECEAAGCYWYDESCHSIPQGGECEDYDNQTECESNGCFWYQKYFWEEAKCHSAEQNMMMDYLPLILAGAGGMIIIAALAMRSSPQQQAPVYMPYPQPQYPQYQQTPT